MNIKIYTLLSPHPTNYFNSRNEDKSSVEKVPVRYITTAFTHSLN